MSIEGLWTGEVYGPFGWEPRGVFVLENGRMVGGDGRQCTAGTYNCSGAKFTAKVVVHYYGPPRTVFGEAKEQFRVNITGELKDDVIDGTVGRTEKPKFDLQFRLTKRMDMPAA